MTRVLTPRDSSLLFAALAANGLFSLASGLVLALASGTVSRLIGFSYPSVLVGVGIGLIVFGGRLLWLARSQAVRRADAIAVSVADLGWVVGTVVLLATTSGVFNATGSWIVIGVALVVLTFFDLQALALWRTRKIAT